MRSKRFVRGGLLLLGMATATWAAVHFSKTSVSLDHDSGDLTVSWKETGLGNGTPIFYSLTSDGVTAEWQCVNPGGNVGPNITTSAGSQTQTQTYVATRNGSVSASLSLDAPPAPSVRDVCPNGRWSLQLTHISYSNVVLTDTTNGLVAGLGTAGF
jgi:hypothetical protein